MDTEIRILLDTIASQTRKRYGDDLRKLDLHVGQDQLMCHLDSQGQLSQVALATILNCEASTISNMVKALEKKQFITKSKDQTDGRTTLIRLSPAGQQKVPAIHESWTVFQSHLLTGFDEATKETLVNLLRQLASNLH